MPSVLQCKSITDYLIANGVLLFTDGDRCTGKLVGAVPARIGRSAMPVTRSMLHGWMLNISDEVSARILLHRNMTVMNVMKSKLEQATKTTERKILESIGEGNGKRDNSE